MTNEEKALIYFKDLRARKFKDYSSVFDTAPKDSVVYKAVSAEIEIYDTTIKALEQTELNPSYNSIKSELEPCDDCISRAEILDFLKGFEILHNHDELRSNLIYGIMNLPSVTPKFTDEEIQKMQELEQAQLDKAYELGKTESFEEWLNSFNTNSATECFTAVQELKKRLEGDDDRN